MIKERVIQLIEFKGLPKEKFYVDIGITSANFRGKAKTTPLNSTTIENILSIVPDLNLKWLITGKGNMLKSDKDDSTTSGEELLELLKENRMLHNENRKLRQISGVSGGVIFPEPRPYGVAENDTPPLEGPKKKLKKQPKNT